MGVFKNRWNSFVKIQENFAKYHENPLKVMNYGQRSLLGFSVCLFFSQPALLDVGIVLQQMKIPVPAAVHPDGWGLPARVRWMGVRWMDGGEMDGGLR